VKPNRPNTEFEPKTFAKLPGLSIVGRSVTQAPVEQPVPFFDEARVRRVAKGVFETNTPSLIKPGEKGDKGDKGDTGSLDDRTLTYLMDSISRLNAIIDGLEIASNCNGGNLTVTLTIPNIEKPKEP
jgi:hypothetical protein